MACGKQSVMKPSRRFRSWSFQSMRNDASLRYWLTTQSYMHICWEVSSIKFSRNLPQVSGQPSPIRSHQMFDGLQFPFALATEAVGWGWRELSPWNIWTASGGKAWNPNQPFIIAAFHTGDDHQNCDLRLIANFMRTEKLNTWQHPCCALEPVPCGEESSWPSRVYPMPTFRPCCSHQVK